MTAIEKKLIQQSEAIFNELDKWKALLELSDLRQEITKSWFAAGTRKLREHLDRQAAKDWRWIEWGAASDTRWYLENFGPGSLGIGFGWQYELHLFIEDQERFDSAFIGHALTEPKYAELLVPFGPHPKLQTRGQSKLKKNPTFTFLNLNADGSLDKEELAWYAAHRTDQFVSEAAPMIEDFIRNEKLTALIRDLNAMADRRQTRAV